MFCRCYRHIDRHTRVPSRIINPAAFENVPVSPVFFSGPKVKLAH